MGGPTASARDRLMEQLIAQHIASATTARTATMIADSSASEPARVASGSFDRRASGAPMQLAAIPPAPPIRIAMADADAPLPPTRSIALSKDDKEDAEGDEDTAERDAPAPALEANRRPGNRDIHEASLGSASSFAPAPPVRIADANPAALGWVKGPDGAPLPPQKVAQSEKAMAAAAALPALLPPAPPVRVASNSPAAHGWVKGPDAIEPPADSKASAAKTAMVAQAKEETPIARNEDSHAASHDGWVIQIGASGDPDKANELLSRAKAQNRSTLASAKPFTEKVGAGDSTFYRARFAGLDSSTAEAACKSLKRSGFSCFATRD
jgi:D-alanyl-D-alanine carboxypeptidase